jgi:hypothetical protein
MINPPNKLDLVGQRFGFLTVEVLDRFENSRRYWRCRCDCGAIRFVTTQNLRSGNTRSCGAKMHAINYKGKTDGHRA